MPTAQHSPPRGRLRGKGTYLFETEHLEADLRGRSVRGTAITMVAQAVTFALNLVGIAVLARLLGPEDFGLIAKVMAVAGFVLIFKDAGLSMATVQRREISHEQVSTLFWCNVVLSLGVSAVIAGTAPLLAWFYHDPQVLGVAWAMAGVFFISGLGIQHQALLRRQMSFTALAAIAIAGLGAGLGAAVAAALAGLGYWALVIQYAGNFAMQVLLLWLLCPWRPSLPRRGSGVRPMLAYGANLSGADVLNYASRNVDNILIGRFVGDFALGLYTRAYGLLLMPIRQINGPLTAVAVPALSRLQDDPERFRRYYYKAIGGITFLAMPIVAFLFVEAQAVVLLVLGEDWVGAVPIFRALGVAAFIGTFNVAGGWVCAALGQTGRQFRWTAASAMLNVVAFAIGVRWGALGVAWAFSGAQVIDRFLGLWYLYRPTPIRLAGLVEAIARPAMTSVVAAGGLYAVQQTYGLDSILLNLLAASMIYFILYLAAWMSTGGGRTQIVDLLRLFQDICRRVPQCHTPQPETTG